jgi:ribose 5-phosphate isomerase B
MTIYLATDHAGFELKNALKAHLGAGGFVVHDCGAHTFDADDDYPDFISIAASHVSKAPQEHRAVICGGSGQGEAMLANRYPNVRATVYYGGSLDIVRLSREHNDANVLSFGARFVTPVEAIFALECWLATPPLADEKYQRRVKKAERHSQRQ